MEYILARILLYSGLVFVVDGKLNAFFLFRNCDGPGEVIVA